MTKSPIQYIDSTLIGPAMLFLNQYFNCVLPEYYVLWGCMVIINIWNVYLCVRFFLLYLLNFYFYLQLWTIFDLAVYSIFVCKEICDYLRVYLFYITPTTLNMKPYASSKITGSSSKNGSNNSSGSYQPHFKYPSTSTMTSFIYPSKTKTK